MKRTFITLLFLSAFACAQKSQSATQSEDAPFNVGPVKVAAGESLYLSVHCNSSARPCLANTPATLDGKVFTVATPVQQNGSTQENAYVLKMPPSTSSQLPSVASADVSVSIVPNKSGHKIHQGWDYQVILQAKP